MTQVASNVPATALNATASLFRERLRALPDGYRCSIYSDGTNLVVRTSQNGTTSGWSAPTTAIAGITSIPATLTTVVTPTALYILRLSGSGIVSTKLPYSGSGVFGTIVTTTPIASVATTPGSIRAVYDGSGTTADSQHISGKTGIIHLLCDSGASWFLYALDPNTAATAPKVVSSTTITTGISSPTYNTDMILRLSGPNASLYLVGSSAAGVWSARSVAYSGSSGQTTYAENSTEYWLVGNFSLNAELLSPNSYYDDGGPLAYASTIFPTTDTASGVGATSRAKVNLGGIGGTVFPAGTWTFQVSLSLQNVKTNTSGAFTLKVGANVYALVGSTYTLIGSMPPGTAYTIPINTIITSTTTSISCSVSLGAYTAPLGAQLVVVPYFVTGTGMLLQPAGTAEILHTQHRVTTPIPSGSQGFTAGATETPGLPASTPGASLCLSDITANPGVDIAINDAGTIRVMNRSSSGAYSPALAVGTGAVAGVAPIIAANGSTGDEVCWWFSSNHIQEATRTKSGWGISNQEDTSATTVQQNFSAVQTGSLSTTGPAILYVNGASPFNLQYEDGGTGSGAAAPTAPVATIVDTPGANDAFGAASPFVTIGAAPVTRVTYNEATANDKLGAVRLVWTDTTASTVAWDSGKSTVTAGPLPGGTIDIAYGSIGNAATAIIPGHVYSVAAFTYESIGGQVSPTSAAITVNAQSAPTATSVSPATITSATGSISFTYGQAESVAAGGVQLEFVSPSGTVDYDTGYLAASITAGGVYTISTLNLAHRIQDNQTYTLRFTLTTAPGSGPVWQGQSTATATINIPTSPQPTLVVAQWDGGDTPLDGGGLVVTWKQPVGTPAAAVNNIYLRETGSTTNSLVASVVPPAAGTLGRYTIYSVGNLDTYDVGVSSVSADGMESIIVIEPHNTVSFSGFWLHQAADPSVCVNLTLVKSGDTFHQWDDTMDEDFAELYDRGAPVHTIGTLYYLQSDADIKFTLPAAYDRAIMAQLMTWRENGELLLIRDWQGQMLFGKLTKASPTAEDAAHIERAVIQFRQVDITGDTALLGA